MTHRVEVHAKGIARLELVPGRSLFENVALSLVEVVDEKVEVQLLGHGPLGPGRRDVVLDSLKGERRHTLVEQAHPLDLTGGLVVEGLDLHAGNTRVKVRQGEWVRTVEGREFKLGFHGPQRSASGDRQASGQMACATLRP